MGTRNRKIRNLGWFLLPALAFITFLLTGLAARNPQFVENYYSQIIYPGIASMLSFLSSWFPFSLDDLFYILLILLPLFLLFFVFLKKISWKLAGKIALNSLAAVYIAFYFLWGFNYYRSGLNQRLGLAGQSANTEDFIRVFERMVEQLNASRVDFETVEKATIDSLVEDSYQKLAPLLKFRYPSGKRRAKEITLSRFFARAGISGYYGPFFNEVHVNRYNLPVEYPFVLAHEKAHQFGITSEAEANFYAWAVCTRSMSKHLRYSANLAIFRYFLYQARGMKQLQGTVEKLDDEVKADYRKIRAHWMKLRDEKIDRAASKVNDVYLKTNKVEQGIRDYSGVVKHVMDFSADSVFMKKRAF